ncbi:MAG: LPXTG cell wall anchor domain-containing protein, partial [Clostridia bacterium]|nr:LPXTG cell wall anchor domain-containing protein [Clostridia bacterium]
VDEPNRVNISYIVIGILLVSLTLYFGLKKRK